MYRGARAGTAPPNEETPREWFERGMCRVFAAGDAVPEPANGGAATPPEEVYSVAALRFTQQFEQDDSGQTMAEYAVVLTVVSFLVIGAITVLSANVATQIARIGSYIHFS